VNSSEAKRLAASQDLHRQGRLQEAAAAYAAICQAGPVAPAALHGLGVIACQQGDLARGAQLFRQAVASHAGYVPAWKDLGAALREMGDAAAAAGCFEKALAIAPGDADAYNSRGEALSALNQHAQALCSFEEAARLDPQDARARSNAGAALLELGRPADALDWFDRALSIRPGHAKALSNRGWALHHLGRHAEAIEQFERALAIDPDYAQARLNRGLTRLLLGQFEAGWPDYEARRLTAAAHGARDFRQPRWRAGIDPAGKTILLHGEQGLGDTLQFCRYVPLVARQASRVILEVPRPLFALLRTLDGAADLVAAGDALPNFDLHCPLLSLPGVFSTRPDDIPSPGAYLAADPERIDQWRGWLGPRRGRPRIGLAWSGSAALKNDRNRSLPLRDLLDAVQGVEADFISLQKEVREADAGVLGGKTGSPAAIRHAGEDLRDFADTAALAALLDLVVTVDTSVAHLAAAIGRPTWILLPCVPDWRWQLDRTDSPWYRSVRLWRQPCPGEWRIVLRSVGAALRSLGANGADGFEGPA